MRKLFASPVVRLALRALLVGVGATVTYVVAADNPVDAAVWKAALYAGAWAAVEAFTPLNALVGLFRSKPA